MARLAFLIGFKGQDPSEKPPDSAKENLIGVFTCKTTVATFLGIETKAYVAKAENVRERKSYTKNVMKSVGGAAPALVDVIVPAGEIIYTPTSSARARTVILKTGAKANKANRTISLTFPSNVTVAQIGEALAEYIPATKIQVTATKPSSTEIYPQFSIKGGRTYSLLPKAEAEASTNVTAPDTPAEQTTVVTAAK